MDKIFKLILDNLYVYVRNKISIFVNIGLPCNWCQMFSFQGLADPEIR